MDGNIIIDVASVCSKYLESEEGRAEAAQAIAQQDEPNGAASAADPDANEWGIQIVPDVLDGKVSTKHER